MADYQKMYYKLMNAVENALEILEAADANALFKCRRALYSIQPFQHLCMIFLHLSFHTYHFHKIL